VDKKNINKKITFMMALSIGSIRQNPYMAKISSRDNCRSLLAD